MFIIELVSNRHSYWISLNRMESIFLPFPNRFYPYLWVIKHLTMKKIFILAFTVLVSLSAQAQVQVALGLKGGANISKFDDASSDNFTSFHGGAFALFKLTKIGIQPELLYSLQGSKFGPDDLKTSYVNIPVMLKLYLVAGLNVQAGPQFGFLNSAKLDGANVKGSLKSSDTSLNFGLGWDLPFGVTLDARYNLGLSDISDDPSFDGLKSRVIQLSVGYKILKFGN